MPYNILIHKHIMTFTFPRLSAGVYQVQKDSNTVAFIRKQSASKWLVVDVVDTPQHVTKTLKEAKEACINLIIFDVGNDTQEVVDNIQESDYNHSVAFEDESVSKSLELQKEMLERLTSNEVYQSPYSQDPTLEPVDF